MLFTESRSERLPPQIVVGSFQFFYFWTEVDIPTENSGWSLFFFDLIDEGNYNRIKKAFQNNLNTSADKQTCKKRNDVKHKILKLEGGLQLDGFFVYR